MAIPISLWRLEPLYGDIKAKIRQEKEAFAASELSRRVYEQQREFIDAVCGMPPAATDEEHQKQVSKMARYAETYSMSAQQFRKVFHETKPVNKVLLLL